MMAPRLLTTRQVRDALNKHLADGFDIFLHEAAGTCIADPGLPRMADDKTVLLILENEQVFEITVKERKD